MTKDDMSIEPIREWLDVKENRKGYLGHSGKDGIGAYYCIPVDVLKDCGMSIDEIFQGKSAIEEREWRRKHVCIHVEFRFIGSDVPTLTLVHMRMRAHLARTPCSNLDCQQAHVASLGTCVLSEFKLRGADDGQPRSGS